MFYRQNPNLPPVEGKVEQTLNYLEGITGKMSDEEFMQVVSMLKERLGEYEVGTEDEESEERDEEDEDEDDEE